MNQTTVRIPASHVIKLIWPYASERLLGQLRTVLPVVAYLFLFQTIVLRFPVHDAGIIAAGLVCVILGLMFFLEGLKLGIMPFSETIGATLPQRSKLPTIIGFAFFLGIGATLAEPAIGALKSAGVNIAPAEAPLLYAMLTRYSGTLVLMVGIGVGVATIIGTLRFLYGWSLKVLIIPTVTLLAAMSLWAHQIGLSNIIGLAWDSGAVTTGPVTVPLILALGIGVCRATGKSDTGLSGFGIVTLASLFPIITVLGLGFYIHYSVPAAELNAIATAAAANGGNTVETFWDSDIVKAVLVSGQAILPLILALFLFQKLFLREPVVGTDEVILGIVFALFGMMLFNFGLSMGLTPLGNQVGSTVPGAFSQITSGDTLQSFGPLYGDPWGKVVALAFACFLGYGATLAEPALNALGTKVEDVTVGAFKKGALIQAVAVGVAVGVTLGLAKVIFDIPLVYMLLLPYTVLIGLTIISSEEFVNIGWDSAGVTTGPVTVPLVIAMGLGVGNSIPTVVEGFGILAMASVCPILSVLTVGLIVKKSRHAQ